MIKSTWEKVFEYASMPVHGTLSRKLRKDVSLQINEGPTYENAVIFLGEEFVRITTDDGSGRSTNTYYDWASIGSLRTVSAKE
jgi:hypothetical protein